MIKLYFGAVCDLISLSFVKMTGFVVTLPLAEWSGAKVERTTLEVGRWKFAKRWPTRKSSATKVKWSSPSVWNDVDQINGNRHRSDTREDAPYWNDPGMSKLQMSKLPCNHRTTARLRQSWFASADRSTSPHKSWRKESEIVKDKIQFFEIILISGKLWFYEWFRVFFHLKTGKLFAIHVHTIQTPFLRFKCLEHTHTPF